jgi:ankyrin repeat protein
LVVTQGMIVSACKRGNIVQLQRWGQQGVRVSSGEPLAWAAELGLVDVMRCLVKDLGANVKEGCKGCPPLFFASQRGHVAAVLCLVKELGANVNQKSQAGATCLHAAFHNGSLAVVRCMVNELGADVNPGDRNGVTCVFMAA